MRRPFRLVSTRTLPFLPVLLLIGLVGAAPFVSALANSVFHDFYGEKSFAGLENFRYILSDAAFGYSLNITVLWALLNTSLSLVAGFLIALALARSRHRLIPRLLMIPMAVPVYIAIPLWRAFLHGSGGDSLLFRLTGLNVNLMTDPLAGFGGALLVSLWLNVPFTAFVLAAHMRKVNRSVLEAAELDGAGTGVRARWIYLPEIRSSLAVMGILNFIDSLKEFTLVFLLTSGGPPLVAGITGRHIVGATTTLGVFLYEVFLQNPDWGVGAAYSVLVAALVAVAMAVWMASQRGHPARILHVLSGVVLLPGLDPVLMAIGAAYAALGMFRPRDRRALPVLAGIHTLYIIIRVLNLGFLAGFHPGILLPLAALALRGTGSGTDIPEQGVRRRFGGGMPFALAAGSTTVTALFALLTLVILYMLIWMSFSRVSSSYVDRLLPPLATAENYRLVFTRERLPLYMLNTLVVAGSTALLLAPAAFPVAAELDRRGWKTTLAFLSFVQVVGIAGGMHTLLPLYGIFRTLKLINTWVPLVLISLHSALPFTLFVLAAFFRSLPASFRDLARIEGMSRFMYAFRILLPLSLPQLVTTGMMAFIGAWNSFQAPLLLLNDERLYTISLKLYGYVGSIGSGSPLWNLFAAASVVNTLFIGTLFLRFHRPMELSPLSDFEN